MIAFGISSFDSLNSDALQGDQLNLHGNLFTSLRGLPELKCLTELNLSSNLFETMALKELLFLPNLKVLDLSGNRIKTLEETPFLPVLKILRISFNLVTHLTGILNLVNLEILDCRGNQLKSVSDCLDIQALGSLQEITMASSDGRHANPICNNPNDVVALFDTAMYFGTINGKDRLMWSTEFEQFSTPHIDRVFRNLAGRLTQTSAKPDVVSRSLKEGIDSNMYFNYN